MANNHPIGLFDSGIGGISIYNEIKKTLPLENTIYIADNLNAPYGKKNEEEIIQLSIKNTQKLLDLGCKLIVVACNTATTNAIEVLREKFNIPIVGIEPSIKPAMLKTKTNNIGVLATEKTLSSNLFQKTSSRFSKGINIHEQIGFDLVRIIEENGINEKLLTAKLKEYIELQCIEYVLRHYDTGILTEQKIALKIPKELLETDSCLLKTPMPEKESIKIDEKNGKDYINIKISSIDTKFVGYDGGILSAYQIRRGDSVILVVKPFDWSFNGKKGVSLACNTVMICGHDDDDEDFVIM